MKPTSTTVLIAALSALAGALVALAAAAVVGVGAVTHQVTVVDRVAVTQPAFSVSPALRSGSGVVFSPPGIYARAAAGVVTVTATLGTTVVSGSGFVVSAHGDLITNAHVVTNSATASASSGVRPAANIYVRFGDGNQLPARVLGFDLFDDIAVLRIDPATGEPLTVLSFDPSRRLAVGDPLAVIGSPFGQEQAQSLSVGVVSALDRELQSPVVSFFTPGVIQTDAAINHGNSGGPVLDAAGRVVGVAAQIESATNNAAGVGFAIPSEAVARSYRAIIRTGSVRYAWLGVSTQPLTAAMATRFGISVIDGLLVDGVTPGGPAEQAGINPGGRSVQFQNYGALHPDADVIVAFNHVAVRNSSDLSLAVAMAEPGQRVPVEVVRRGSRVTVTVTLGLRPAQVP